MISSTANVAIPAASPERRISGSPTRSAKAPPTAPAIDERRDVADRRVAEEVEEVRHERGLLLLRHREHAGRPRADRDEADVPEREHAGVPDEDVQRDDDRDRDERVDEVDLGRARDGRTDERRRRRPARPAPAAATSARRASYALHRPRRRVNSPSGRTSRTRITRPKTNDGQVLALRGRQRAAEDARRRTRSRSRRASPRAAGVIPPTTTPASTMIVSRKRERRRHGRELHGQHAPRRRQPAIAGDQHRDRAHEVRPHAERGARSRSPSPPRACAGRSTCGSAAARAARGRRPR